MSVGRKSLQDLARWKRGVFLVLLFVFCFFVFFLVRKLEETGKSEPGRGTAMGEDAGRRKSDLRTQCQTREKKSRHIWVKEAAPESSIKRRGGRKTGAAALHEVEQEARPATAPRNSDAPAARAPS